MSRSVRGRIGGALLAASVLAGVSVVSAPAASAAPLTLTELLDRPRQGAAAIAALGLQLAEAATRNDTTPAVLLKQLQSDPTVWLDRLARRFVVEPTAQAPTGTETTTPLSSIPDADTFLLHSKAGSNRTIYLDFDGEVVQNTAWNQNYTSGAAFTAEPYDSDGVPGSFNATELNVIKSVWQRVAEDYAPFDVDVTTQAPDPAAITRSDSTDQVYGTRALITNTSNVYSSCGCGGVAYVGTFDSTSNHSYYQPAFVFQRGLGTGAKNLAEAASHEVGHNLGLSHDGTASTGYYSGQGAWAPIMGVGYYKPVSQWSRGEYSGANNTEDDFAVMQANGAALRADDFGNNAASASVVSGPTASVIGRITNAADVDAFSITAGAGSATFSVTPGPTSPNLDASLTVLDANGAQVAYADPASAVVSGDVASGLNASISVTLAAGAYTVLVNGVGAADPVSTGYSDYGSVGMYTLTASVAPSTSTPPPPANVAPTARLTPTSSTGVAPVTVSFDGRTSSDSDGTIASYAWAFGDGSSATGSTTSHTYTAAGTYTVTLTVTDNAGATGTATGTVTVTAAPSPVPAAPSAVSATYANRRITVRWTDNSSNETGFYVYREKWNTRYNRWDTISRITTTKANVVSYVDNPSTGTYRYSVAAFNSAGTSALAVSGSVKR